MDTTVRTDFIWGVLPRFLFACEFLVRMRRRLAMPPLTESTLKIARSSIIRHAVARLGRSHGAREAIAAVENAHAAGFEEINLDLMFGLPGQSVAEALADIEQAIALQPTHISHYQLTIEPNTHFAHAPPSLPDEDVSWEMQQRCQARLAE